MTPRIALLLSLAALSSCSTLPEDPCQDSRVPTPRAQHTKACAVAEVPFLRDGVTQTAQLIVLDDGLVLIGDQGVWARRSFIRTPDGKLLPVEYLLQLGGVSAIPFILDGLGIEPSRAGGLAGIPVDDSAFHSRRLFQEGSDGKICVVYRMKPPLEGQVVDCDGRNPAGKVGYGPGVLTWKQSFDAVCNRFQSCNPGDVHTSIAFREVDGSLHYLVLLPMNGRWRVNAATGAVRFSPEQ